MRKFGFATIVAAAMVIGSASPALAGTPVSISLTGSMVDTGTYGNSLTFPQTGALQVKVTGWQVNQGTGAVTTAYTGAYSPGLGVTGIGDASGSSNYHQIDNAGGYNDFVLLQFSQAVTINSVYLSSFLLGSATVKDNDLAFSTINVPTTTWDAKVDLTNVPLNTSKWTTVLGTGADGTVAISNSTISSQWLIGAAFNAGNDDGFKLKTLNVTAVPEPATWATMILGMGLVGGALRRRRAAAAVAAA